MKRGEFKKEGTQIKEQNDGGSNRTSHFDFLQQQNFLSSKRENVSAVTGKYLSEQVKINETFKHIKETIQKLGEMDEISLLQLKFIQDTMSNYNILTREVNNVLGQSDNLQTYDWVQAERRAANCIIAVDTFFRTGLQSIIQRYYSKAMSEYSSIVTIINENDKKFNIRNTLENIDCSIKKISAIFIKNWNCCDFTKKEVRDTAFGALNYISQQTSELKSLHLGFNIELIDSEQQHSNTQPSIFTETHSPTTDQPLPPQQSIFTETHSSTTDQPLPPQQSTDKNISEKEDIEQEYKKLINFANSKRRRFDKLITTIKVEVSAIKSRKKNNIDARIEAERVQKCLSCILLDPEVKGFKNNPSQQASDLFGKQSRAPKEPKEAFLKMSEALQIIKQKMPARHKLRNTWREIQSNLN